MIVAIAAAAALAPSKDALIERWLRANHAHVVVRLAPAPRRERQAAPSLITLHSFSGLDGANPITGLGLGRPPGIANAGG